LPTVGRNVVVSNTRGIDARRPTTAAGHGTHDTTSSLTRFTLPSDRVVRALTAKVFAQNGWTPGSVPYGGGYARPVPVPARIGDPSTIKHVFLVVKENRTYDQMYGDETRADGDPSVNEFGENVTPNQHELHILGRRGKQGLVRRLPVPTDNDEVRLQGRPVGQGGLDPVVGLVELLDPGVEPVLDGVLGGLMEHVDQIAAQDLQFRHDAVAVERLDGHFRPTAAVRADPCDAALCQ